MARSYLTPREAAEVELEDGCTFDLVGAFDLAGVSFARALLAGEALAGAPIALRVDVGAGSRGMVLDEFGAGFVG